MRRTLPLFLTLALALALPAFAADDEAKAGAAVENLGAVVKRDPTLPGKPVVEVSFQGSTTGRPIKDADLAALHGLKHLKVLYLGYVTTTTDAGLVHLRGLTSLEKLALPETKITDAGLVNLRTLANLKSLGFPFCKGITDRGLVHLNGLKKLTELNVAGTSVTPKGIADLQKALPKAYIIH
jgi:hypothetical protein